MAPRAAITGITGQDGSYLTELLLEKGYDVHGLLRRTCDLSRSWISHLYRDPKLQERRLFVHYADLDDATTLRRTLLRIRPTELYHLAGQSHVGLSFEIPEATCQLTAMGTLRLLEILRDLPEPTRFFHASSSEIFGRPEVMPQNEMTPIAPVNPYGCAKAFATQIVRVYRESYRVYASNGILFNHESPRRGAGFVTRKICRAAAAIRLGLERELRLGDLSAQRDWGDARDYVRGMWHSLQHSAAEDFVFATGQTHSVQDVVEIAFAAMDLDWKACVKRDERLVRPAEPNRLIGDSAKARDLLGWKPQTDFRSLIVAMTESEHRSLAAPQPFQPQPLPWRIV
ncbi:MAG: GDP-mannose 4,6-dehydratase [Verrucomicrobia bacterium]|nr:GDP-mannose 4,6-dehydratase [Verrucomicrobiota bacterium]